MQLLHTSSLTDDALSSYDRLMVHSGLSLEVTSSLADQIWAEVLGELERREMIELVSGKLSHPAGARIVRKYSIEN
ncbi:hypothetical protein [Paracoccus haeundaensis]|uniref:Uncharacterized protein n=1 Tax=Paracoccus haeundaensis TaxID=225362 RepID=A0A5C4RBC0_9RHOB|nr:hypothetical protein [Paracoccus haeundaensis]TNH41270.1 hypothetical protein FHD67_00720 [Paracoccus haeundaensis]